MKTTAAANAAQVIPFTDEQLDELCRRYLNGATIIDLEADFGISNTAVRRRLRLRGVQMRPQGRRRKS